MVARNRTWRGFTMTELVVVLAILAVLSAILFPVFLGARAAAHKTVCISNFKQANTAMQIYLNDYNDTFMQVNYDVAHLNNPERDRTWVQLLLPYTKGLDVFTCPSDYGTKDKSAGTFDADLVIGDPYKRYYRASMRSNIGYNYLYYSPVYRVQNRWVVEPRTVSQISSAAQSLVFVDSVYGRSPTGIPYGGGSYIVLPPCRYGRTASNAVYDTFMVGNAPVFTPNNGWVVSNQNSPFRFGLAYPWHFERMNVSFVSGGAVAVPKARLAEGCDTRDNWSGLILDNTKYAWDGF